MGTSWSARIVDAGPGAKAGILTVLDRIIAQMSHWEPASDLCRFNRAAPGNWQQLPPELSRVLGAGLSVASASGGAFDPAMGALVDLWGFGPPGPRTDAPTRSEIAAALGGSIEHDPTLLRARRTAPAALDFSGIAKGYAVDAIARHLCETGHADFLVEVGGELFGEGVKPDGQPWWVDLEPVPGLAPIRVALHGLAVATSGAGQRNFIADGRRYSHTLDPRTGGPIANGVAQVTVIHPECMLADAWATALTVLGDQAPSVAEREGLAMHMAVRDGGAMREVTSPALAEMLAA
ncbi:FAD:protein FMN transferase [Sphingomonas sp. AOB5]|uniref:FAD:protein FMN transferase n=1 Tax=Sphingomonas sp. AOB5 TaxID=3034017 RepID=UPI0023F9A224|nr:FAD:protein FMN transferase [Sphingomonas sp. AOB5]MDF7776802.1 FAD:protein FMN transferase [Sphingomonas sp. AOB5]